MFGWRQTSQSLDTQNSRDRLVAAVFLFNGVLSHVWNEKATSRATSVRYPTELLFFQYRILSKPHFIDVFSASGSSPGL